MAAVCPESRMGSLEADKADLALISCSPETRRWLRVDSEG